MIRTLAALAALMAVVLASPHVQAQTVDVQKLERNKKIVTALYNAALNEKDFDKARQYLGEKYTQHNPVAADGPEGLKAFIGFLREKFPNNKSEIKRIFAEGDYVIVHVHAMREAGTRGFAIIDIFRLEGDKVVEHWDAVQPIPEKAANNNGMF
jgi:predicted SnoaL-like aldol condensation-catalyzing enzyme